MDEMLVDAMETETAEVDVVSDVVVIEWAASTETLVSIDIAKREKGKCHNKKEEGKFFETYLR